MPRFENNNYNHNNGKAVWSSGRPDAYPATRFRGREPRANRRENGGFRGPHGDDGDGESRQPEEPRMEETSPATLDLVLERLERLERFGKFETERDDTARRVDNLDHSWSRETDQPSGFGVGGDWGYDETRRMRSGERAAGGRNPNWGFHEGPQDARARRDTIGRNGPEWTTQGNRNPRQSSGGVRSFF